MFSGVRLKQLRKGRYSQEELADLLNVHNNTVSKWENEAQTPHPKKIEEIAKILGTTKDYLLGFTDDSSPNYKFEEIKSITPNQLSTFHDRNEISEMLEDKNNLVYEWGEGHKLILPNTPETRQMFQQIVLLSMNNPTTAGAMA